VAVKIQKPEIRRQINADLLCFKAATWILEKVFDLPLYWSASYIEEHLREEVDFIREGRNSEMCFSLFQQVPRLRDRVYVPRVYWALTTPRVLVAEWIDGVQLGDVEQVKKMGFTLKDIMTVVVNMFSDQIFRSGFVHRYDIQENKRENRIIF
jgi:aarF domain-containing kinase